MCLQLNVGKTEFSLLQVPNSMSDVTTKTK